MTPAPPARATRIKQAPMTINVSLAEAPEEAPEPGEAVGVRLSPATADEPDGCEVAPWSDAPSAPHPQRKNANPPIIYMRRLLIGFLCMKTYLGIRQGFR